MDSAQKSVESMNAEVKESGLPPADLRPYECNTADEEAVKKTFDQIVKDFGRVDVVCTNGKSQSESWRIAEDTDQLQLGLLVAPLLRTTHTRCVASTLTVRHKHAELNPEKQEWKQMLDVNLNGTFLFARAAGKHMIEKDIKGSIIVVSSMSGRIVNRPQKQSAYNTVSSPVLRPVHGLVRLTIPGQSRNGDDDEVIGCGVG